MFCFRFSLYTKGNTQRPINHMYFRKLSSAKKLITPHHATNYVCILEYGEWPDCECEDEFV